MYSSKKPAIPNSPKYNTSRTRTQPGKHEAGNTSKVGNRQIKRGSLSWVSVRSNIQRSTAYFWLCIGLMLRTRTTEREMGRDDLYELPKRVGRPTRIGHSVTFTQLE